MAPKYRVQSDDRRAAGEDDQEVRPLKTGAGAGAGAGAVRAYRVRVNEQGRLVIPAALRETLGLKAGSFVTVEALRRGEIRVSTLLAGVDRARAIARKYVGKGAPSAADELIADRRRESERE